ncbi:MAG: LacI family DNA-binding transcriptional regulator [Clostridia bacterium]
MFTIRDVAKLSGVSVATVSRVMNDSSAVAPKTRAKVLDAIKELNYQPNLLGRDLRRSETKRILVLLPTISNSFYSNIVKGIEDVAHRNDYTTMLCNTDSDSNRENVYLEMLRNRLSDGLILMGPEISRKELEILGKDFPVVQCCEYIEGANVSHISIDNFKASVKAVNHLINAGHKRIGLICCKNRFISTSQRIEGYRNALESAGLEYDPGLVQYVNDYEFKSGLRAMEQLLKMPNQPTAIFALSDTVAIGAIRRIMENELRVPEDIAVVGFDDISFASMFNPALTTIAQPKYDLGCAAMELLLKQMNGEVIEPQSLYLEHELIIRESTIK